MDPASLKLGQQALVPKKASQAKAPRPKSGNRFLRGPVPMDWICTASTASGRGSGLKVAIALWYLSGLNGQARTVKLRGSVLREMGVDRHAVYRGLQVLEKAGLVSVARHPGRNPLVTIREAGEAT